ncbi:disulfide bond formation protein B [mine drainage metagenome]|uniref:Disulfide bond formation protein B n=1 Tax=mine drainage metagenome TaxID=410659 RepID=A0A1J5RQ57_9ZZZZ
MPRLLRLSPALILLACLLALGGALTAQFGFGLRPCILCLYQRGPYVVSALLALAALLPLCPPRLRVWLLGLCALSFAVNGGIAIFHVGVEQHWWHGTAACVPVAPVPTTPAEMMAALSAPPPPRCDQAAWTLWGISMAGFNVPASFVLAAFAAWAARALGRR